MLFDADFIAQVESDPVIGLKNTCTVIFEKLQDLNIYNEWTDLEYELLLEGSAFISIIIKTFKLPIDITAPLPNAKIDETCVALKNYIDDVYYKVTETIQRQKATAYSSRYQNVFKSTFAYEFSSSDIDRVQQLLNELRVQITSLESLEENHRSRLLKRLETLQSELHKRISDLDRFWGLVGDAGVVLGKFGTDSKPIVDRIREIAQIAWKTQSRTEGLPSNTPNPMLESKE